MLPTCTARVGQQAKGMVQHPGCSATLLSSMWIDGKGHHVYASYSSSGVLIKEDEQKTIAVARKPHLRVWVKEWGMEFLSTGKGCGGGGGGVMKIRKQEKYFITLMKKGNRSINVFLKRLWVIENLLRNLGV